MKNLGKGRTPWIKRSVYLASIIIAFVAFIYKCGLIGILPIYKSDWIQFQAAQKVSKLKSWTFVSATFSNSNHHLGATYLKSMHLSKMLHFSNTVMDS